MKFGRRYKLEVQGVSHKTHTFEFPLTVKFRVERHYFAGSSSANFSIYGLSKSAREDIYFDWYFKPSAFLCTFSAGYETQGPQLSKVFVGNINVAYTDRQGPELITHVEALDGGYGVATGTIPSKFSIKKGTSYKKAMTNIMTVGFPGAGLQPGKVIVDSAPQPDFTEDASPAGKSWDTLLNYTPQNDKGDRGYVFIDNGFINILGPDDHLPSLGSGLVELKSSTGLLNVPKRYGTVVECQSVFEPAYNVGQPVKLLSTLNAAVNGEYTVIGICHEGTISGVESGDAITTLTLSQNAIGRSLSALGVVNI